MNRVQMYVNGCPRSAKAYPRACRMSLLAFIPIGSLSPCGMRMLDAYGVGAPVADLTLAGAMALPFVGIFLWSFLGERFWDRLVARFAVVRFALKWALAIFFLEAGIVLLTAIKAGAIASSNVYDAVAVGSQGETAAQDSERAKVSKVN